MDDLKERFWRAPMFKWRCIITGTIGALFLGNMGVLGFHVPREPQGTIFLATVALLWCICDAADALRATITSSAR